MRWHFIKLPYSESLSSLNYQDLKEEEEKEEEVITPSHFGEWVLHGQVLNTVM